MLLELFTIYRDWQEEKAQKITKRQVGLILLSWRVNVIHFYSVLADHFISTLYLFAWECLFAIKKWLINTDPIKEVVLQHMQSS